ncbi:oxidoreductase [Alicyclobacillus cellulosilyticus]|uniref:Oxidoreductase n=1 Tax=Alicyclobacillus cellulosilyticus TaxID=1003997 RepID=A0A917K518_9BACL|nr:Gfo/Idh/MocA family oxidoreductase [Alicyclobacillus cellulosilyticus]GGI98379.1 oxidoreductase [Alicyclobacillus cellulosilyticus]
MSRQDGMNYAPQGKPAPVCEPGEFVFAAIGLDHGHIYGMCNGLLEAGGQLKWVYDPDPAKVERFLERYPGVRAARSEQEVLQDKEVHLVASACVPVDREPLGVRVMRHGKDYFTDKPPLTTLAQLEEAKRVVAETGRKYAVYYSERLHVESAVHAGDLIADGAIGEVVQVMGMGPHRMSPQSRPAWFFDPAKFGGILCDIGSHQVEQILYYAGAKDAKVLASRVGNYAHPEYPDFQDFGDASILCDNGVSGYFRVDWFTPDGLGTWGDGRTFILGTKGYIELRKYIDVARDPEGDKVYLVNGEGEFLIDVRGKVGYPYFGRLIRDVLERTETAMTQEHAFKAAEVCLRAQAEAVRIETRGGKAR